MSTYSEFKPTVFDNHIEIEDRENWLVAPVSQTRDSSTFDKCNFQAALEMLGGESDTVEVHRFGHWGPGWFEIIIVDPSREDDVDGIHHALANYPVLDDSKLSEMETEDEDEAWKNWVNHDLNRTLPEWLDNAFEDLQDKHAFCEEEAFSCAQEEANVGFEHYSEGCSIDIDRLSKPYADALADILDVEKCTCFDEETEWGYKCPICDNRYYVMRDWSHLNQLELPLDA